MGSALLRDKKESRREWETAIWKKLIQELAAASSSREVEQMLNALFTAHEKKQFIDRAAAMALLEQRKTYREIGDILWLSPATISAVRKSLQAKKGYVSRYARWKVEGRKKKHFSVLPQRATTMLISPHGKRAFPRRIRLR